MSKRKRATFNEKLNRLKTIKEMLEKSEKPLTFGEIYEQIKKKYGISDRMAENYLQELRELEVIAYDEENEVYKPARFERLTFQSKADYELALQHSRNLLFTQPNGDNQRYDLMNPRITIDILAGLLSSLSKIEDECFIEHLKWGYPKIYMNLQRYRELALKLGYSPRDLSLLPPRHIYDLELNRNFQSQQEYDTFYAENKEKIEEFKNLREYLISEIYNNIMEAVKHGIPLKGHCKYCPHLHITIKKRVE